MGKRESNFYYYSPDEALLLEIPNHIRREVIQRLRTLKKDKYIDYEIFRMIAKSPEAIKNFSTDEAKMASSMLLQIGVSCALWLCIHCKKVIGLIECPSDIEPKRFIYYLVILSSQEKLKCPACGNPSFYFVRPDFLLSGLSIEEPFREERM